MDAIVDYAGGVKFRVKAGRHEVFCDQPASNGGADEGMSPPEFLLVSLGTCAGFYAVQYLRTRALPADGVRVEVHAGKSTDRPARLSSFRIDVFAPGLEPKHHDGILRAVKACLIHNTLLNPPAIETALHTEIPAAV